jgi:Zn-dependent protease
MMQPIRLGRLFGIPLEARVSFLAMLAFVLLFMGGLSGIFIVLVAFGSVILHELGHALVARRLGVGVSGIELHFFGGVARLESQPKSNRDEIAIAAAGPAVSFALSGLGFLLSFATGWALFDLLATVNLVIAVFNLLPALPMDGGRILRALLASKMGHRRATELAVKISRVVAVAFGVIGLAYMQLQLVLLAGVLWVMATAELRHARRTSEQGGTVVDGGPWAADFVPPQGMTPRIVIVERGRWR